jgi:hypothetical protein
VGQFHGWKTDDYKKFCQSMPEQRMGKALAQKSRRLPLKKQVIHLLMHWKTGTLGAISSVYGGRLVQECSLQNEAELTYIH